MYHILFCSLWFTSSNAHKNGLRVKAKLPFAYFYKPISWTISSDYKVVKHAIFRRRLKSISWKFNRETRNSRIKKSYMHTQKRIFLFWPTKVFVCDSFSFRHFYAWFLWKCIWTNMHMICQFFSILNVPWTVTYLKEVEFFRVDGCFICSKYQG